MSVTKEQCRRVAQLLYPQLWLTNRIEAVAKAIEFLHEAAGGLNNNEVSAPETHVQAGRPAAIIKSLVEHMKRSGIHVNLVARSVGVSPYTVRTWIDGKYKPNDENSKKISDFIESGAQPETAET